MDYATAQALVSSQGQRALTAAAALEHPDSLAAAEAMRRDFPAQLAAAATTQVGLRRAGRTKLGDRAATLLWTRDGLEQATRADVARWRAAAMVEAHVRRVVDLGCGIGADALAFLDAGLQVVAVEIDPATALLAEHNLPGAEVICGDATQLAAGLLAGAGPESCVFLDPARRTERGRSWRVEDLRPSWGFLLGLLGHEYGLCAKLGPGVALDMLPAQVDARWVSEHGDLVECGLWALPGAGAGGRPDTGRRSAVLLPEGLEVDADPGDAELPVAPPGRHLYEPDPAVSRAGALAAIGEGLWRLDPRVAYLSSEELVETPLARTFEVLEVLDPDIRVLRHWVGEHRVGRLEIKKRAVQIDPVALRRALRPKGPNAATLVLSPTPEGTRAMVVRRLPRG